MQNQLFKCMNMTISAGTVSDTLMRQNMSEGNLNNHLMISSMKQKASKNLAQSLEVLHICRHSGSEGLDFEETRKAFLRKKYRGPDYHSDSQSNSVRSTQ